MFQIALKKPLLKEFIILSFVITALHALAYKYNLYYWSVGGEFDSAMHFLGGLIVSLFFLWLYFFSGFFSPSSRKYTNFLIIGGISILLVGFAWEAYELILGLTFVSSGEYLEDTTLDIIFDCLGVIAGCIYAYDKERNLKANEPNAS